VALLSLANVSKNYAGLRVLNDIQLDVESGERRAIIGPNGAGKTTLFHLISGQVPPSSGTVVFDGEDVTKRAPYQMARRGLARTFQTNNLFLHLTVFENVRLAVQRRMDRGRQWFRPWWALDDVNERTDAVLARAGLASRAEDLATNLPYGEQRQLEMAIALAGEPKLLLLDEPTAGMSRQDGTRHRGGALPRDLTLLIIERHGHDLRPRGSNHRAGPWHNRRARPTGSRRTKCARSVWAKSSVC
jgi:branched-chain amino acid transport system ATP-binding protein